MITNSKVSVIVPVYKAEKYLAKCVNSILNQTYSNIEVLLVDDGSPDKSIIICEDFAQKDSRVKVFHEKNSGVSTARNLALNHVSGKWIMFVDSDDWLETDCISCCINITERNNLDLLQFASKRVDDDGQILVNKVTQGTGVMLRDEYINSADRLNVSVWGSLLRNDIIQKNVLRFDTNLKLGEDQLFIFRYTNLCHRCMKIANEFYNYRYNLQSATATTNPRECLKSLDAFKNFELRNEFDFYIQRGILRFFLYPIIDSKIISIKKIYSLIRDEKFNKLHPIQKFEKAFFPIYHICKLMGILYLIIIKKIINFQHQNTQ